MISGKGIDKKVTLIDYGYVSKYVDSENKHLDKSNISIFTGNLMFASIDQLNYLRPSRRSDFHSLCYIIIYILNNLQIPYLDTKKMESMSVEDCLEYFIQFKTMNKLDDLAKSIQI